MRDISTSTCTLGKHFSDRSQRQLEAKPLRWRSWAQRQGSSSAPIRAAKPPPSSALRSDPGPRDALHSRAFHGIAILPLPVQSTCRHTIPYIYSKSRAARKRSWWCYFCCTFKLLFFGSWLNLADFSSELTRRICSARSACAAAGTIASRQPHEPFKIRQQFLLWPSVHGIRLKCF